MSTMSSTTELSQTPTTPPPTTQTQNAEVPTSTSHSPNSSPSRRRKRYDRTDSFLLLANAPIPSREPSPHTADDDTAHHEDDSIIQWAIIGPLSFVSFLISLALVDHRERSRRLNEHPSRDHSVFRTLTAWIDPVPYASSRAHTDPNAASAASGASGVKERRGKEEGTNYIMKKHRKMAALSANDAFAMRGRVMVGVVAVFLLGVVGVTWLARRASEFVFERVWA